MSSRPRPDHRASRPTRTPLSVYGEPPDHSGLTRWRRDLLAYLSEAEAAVRNGAGEAHMKRRLEGLVRALDHRLEQARRGG